MTPPKSMLEKLLNELASYWQMSSQTRQFEDRLHAVCAQYPRLFDMVENRVVTQLFKFSPTASVAGLDGEQFHEWLKSLGPLMLQHEEERLAAEKRRQEAQEEREKAASLLKIVRAARTCTRQQKPCRHPEEEREKLHRQRSEKASRIDRLVSKMQAAQRADRQQIIDFMQARNIRSLVHFTRIENLESILQHGIIPRAHLAGDFVFNDEHRFDGFLEASSLSISFPNYKLLYTHQCHNPGKNWVVIGIRPEVMLELPCLYFHSNAARTDIRKDEESLIKRMGIIGLKTMFYDDHPAGRCLCEENWTTDPQAEVMAFGTIDPKYFMRVVFKHADPRSHTLLRSRFPGLGQFTGGSFFNPRADWQRWTSASADAFHDTDLELLYG